LTRIRELVKQLDAIKSASPTGAAQSSSTDDAIALVKSWVKAGLFRDAVSGHDDASLKLMAYDKQLPALPALTADQEKQLSRDELRVYSEARWWQANYATQPASLEDAKSQFINMTLTALPDAIAQMKASVASGVFNDEQKANATADLSAMEAQLSAVRSGNVKIELMDSSSYTMTAGTWHTLRDSAGLIIGGEGTLGGPRLTDAGHTQYGVPAGEWAYYGSGTLGFSDYLGAYAISWG
jgi:hypothetical protein